MISAWENCSRPSSAAGSNDSTKSISATTLPQLSSLRSLRSLRMWAIGSSEIMSGFIHHAAVVLGAGDVVGRVQAGQDELHATGAHCGVVGGVDFECLVPCRRHALQPIGVIRRREHVAHFDLHALAKDFCDLFQPVA